MCGYARRKPGRDRVRRKPWFRTTIDPLDAAQTVRGLLPRAPGRAPTRSMERAAGWAPAMRPLHPVRSMSRVYRRHARCAATVPVVRRGKAIKGRPQGDARDRPLIDRHLRPQFRARRRAAEREFRDPRAAWEQGSAHQRLPVALLLEAWSVTTRSWLPRSTRDRAAGPLPVRSARSAGRRDRRRRSHSPGEMSPDS